MKILYVITKANWGGAQRYVYDLATSAKARGYEAIVAYGVGGEMGKRLNDASVRTLELREMGRDVNVGNDYTSFLSLIEVLRNERPDVVHLNSSKAGGLGALASRIMGVPTIIFTSHGWAFNEDRPAYQKKIIAFLHYVTVVLSHRTICVSEAIYKDASWMPFVQSKLCVIHHGIEEPEFLERTEARKFLLPDVENGFLIGMIGELHKTKGIYEAIDAFAETLSAIPDAYLVILGEGTERKGIEKVIHAHSLEKRILLKGHVVSAPKYLKAFDIFLFPSRTEALGYALLEAGYAALPVVATRVGGIPEIVTNNETGFLVSRGNSEEIKKALITLEGDSTLRRTLGEALRTKVVREFPLEAMIDGTFTVYKS